MGMVRIEVFGSEPPCSGCMVVVKRVKEAAGNFKGKVAIEEIGFSDERAEKYKVRVVPQVFINGSRFVTKGKPTVAELEEQIKKVLGG